LSELPMSELPLVSAARLIAGQGSGEGLPPASYRAAEEIDRLENGSAGDPESEDVQSPSGIEQFESMDAGLEEALVHGTAVAANGKAALFVGRPGSGKSAAALSMLPLGASLVCDDQVLLRRTGASVEVCAIPGFEGMIEARGVGILKVPSYCEAAELAVVVDLDRTELHRLPPARTHQILTTNVHLVYGRENWSLGPALMALLPGGLLKPDDP